MNYDDSNRVFFNQNLIFYKDKIYNSNGILEISITNNTTDYKSFSAPNLHISVIGENNLRRLYSISYYDSVDLFCSIKEIMKDIDTIYNTGRLNVLIKKYQFDKILKFEFIQIQGTGDRVVTISIVYNNSDFTKVIIPYSVFTSFSIGILKYFVNEYINITFSMSTRNLLTELLEQNKLIRNGITILPTSIIKNTGLISEEIITPERRAPENEIDSSKTEEIMDDFDRFLGNNMQNIEVEDLTNKSIIEDKKSNNIEVTSEFITKTLTKDLSVMERMLTAASTRHDSMISLFEGFRRSMNLDESFSFLPNISKNDLNSFLYISKLTHDIYLNLNINDNKPIPSGFATLKYNVDREKINFINTQLCNDVLLISGFVKIFRSRMESRESNINKNGALFYLRLRLFLDPIVYSFLDINQGKVISTTICSNFEKYNEFGFFDNYQNILKENGCEPINVNDIKEFSNELNSKILSSGVLKINIDERHESMFNSGFLRIKSDNNLNIEQILKELVPLEVLEKSGVNLEENSDDLRKAIESFSISNEIVNIFLRKEEKEPVKEKESNILRTVKFFNNEIPESYRNEFFNYISDIKYENFDFKNSKYEIEELGENIVKALYIWNESDDKKEPLSSYRLKLEDCLLTKDLIINKVRSENKVESIQEWDLDILD